MKKIKYIAGTCMLFFLGFGFSSCTNFLDVVPPEQVNIPDFTKDFYSTQKFLYSCYAGIAVPFNYDGLEAAADEYALPPRWGVGPQNITYNLNNTANPVDGMRWNNNYYKYIGQCLLFIQQLPVAREVPDSIKPDWEAQAEFLITYYHMMTLILYGPCPITDHYIAQDVPSSAFPGRYHFDYMVDWICKRFDDEAKVLPAKRELTDWGLATSTMCKALKARLLLYAASPLWNGEFPFGNWRNTNFTTPGYGYDLVSHTYSRDKWVRAKDANKQALDFAESVGGNALYKDETQYSREGLKLPYVPGVDSTTADGREFLKKVMMFRYLVTTRSNEGNKELIWGIANQGNIVTASIPHWIMDLSNGSYWGGYGGVSPILNTTIEYFYTKNGKRPADDPAFTPGEHWFESANIPNRTDIIKLNVGREPRFYAWMAFDGGDYSSKLAAGNPVKIQLRNSNTQGFNDTKYSTNNNVTGYFSQKYILPNMSISASGTSNQLNKPRPMIRLAELYLNLAECYAALSVQDSALHYVNEIRKRAGVPVLTPSDLTGDMNLKKWIQNERFIELWGEGQRYYDIRRWMIAPETMGQDSRMGLNAYGVKNPSFKFFNSPSIIDQPFRWADRMYLLPLHNDEVYFNPQLQQAPGY